MPINTIAEVLNRLDTIIQETEIANSRQGYFAVLYRRMTLAVQQGIQQNVFKDGTRMERLDVIFATRYLDAYLAYQTNEPLTDGWQTVFDACKLSSLTVIQHLILGVNTHINLDLAIAAADTCPGETIFAMQADYNKINDIIASLIDEVQDKLTKIWWPLKLLRNIVNSRQDAVIDFSIVEARRAAWASGVALANLQGGTRNGYINTMDNMVVVIAKRIINPGFFINLLLKFIRLFEDKNVRNVIQLINDPE
jgi:hypothetical protein